MRRTGGVRGATGLFPGDHVRRTYAEDDEHCQALDASFADGITAGEKLLSLGPAGAVAGEVDVTQSELVETLRRALLEASPTFRNVWSLLGHGDRALVASS
ncbi:MAG TPA: hypothetical protein VFA94_10990 [Acidimicrobiales bacterium]|nr:hypothetical protein [Acidimicrobiales bacterium]